MGGSDSALRREGPIPHAPAAPSPGRPPAGAAPTPEAPPRGADGARGPGLSAELAKVRIWCDLKTPFPEAAGLRKALLTLEYCKE